MKVLADYKYLPVDLTNPLMLGLLVKYPVQYAFL